MTMFPTHVLLFAYDPRQHGMIREWVPVDRLEARAAQLRAAGLEVSHLPPGVALKPDRRPRL